MNSDQLNSLGRTALKYAGGALVSWAVAHGAIDPAGAATLTPLLEALGGAVLGVAGWWLSHRTHAAA